MSVRVIEVAADDPRVADYRNLTDVGWRQQMEPAEGLFLAEGEKVILRALAAGYTPRSALMSERWLPALRAGLESHPVDVMIASETTMRSIVGFRLHRGALAAFGRIPRPDPPRVLAYARRIVVLEDLVDHTNVGLVFRTAAALGMDAVLVSPRCADPYYRRSVKTSMGAVLTMPWTHAQPWPGMLADLRADDWQLAALTPAEEAEDLRAFATALDPHAKLAMLLGTEGPGLSRWAQEQCTVRLRIPVTERVDSLNVAAAAAIASYELGNRQA